MPKTLNSVDPEAEDDFDTYDDETEMVWTWSRVHAQKQWTNHCSKNSTSGACIEMNYTRVCPSGKGLYEKKLYSGSTYREKARPKDVYSNLLEWVAPMTYECPQGTWRIYDTSLNKSLLRAGLPTKSVKRCDCSGRK